MTRTEAVETVSHRGVSWRRQIPRWFVGLVLIATGIGKALDIPGFVRVITAYALGPAWIYPPLAHILPFVELATGVCLLAGVKVRDAAWVAVGLHAGLLTVVIVTLWRGIVVANCGCFGVFWARPVDAVTVVEDAVMLVLSVTVLWQNWRRE